LKKLETRNTKLETRINSNSRLFFGFPSMSSHRYLNRANQSAYRRGESSAIHRLAAILESNLHARVAEPNITIPLPPSNHSSCCHYPNQINLNEPNEPPPNPNQKVPNERNPPTTILPLRQHQKSTPHTNMLPNHNHQRKPTPVHTLNA
jgi:hypothetical protein